MNIQNKTKLNAKQDEGNRFEQSEALGQCSQRRQMALTRMLQQWKRPMIPIFNFFTGLLSFLVMVLLISGCSGHAGIVYLNKTTDCTVQCYDMTSKYGCFQSTVEETNYCKCVLLDCFKGVPIQEKPSDYSNAVSYSKVLTSQECYKNGVSINCSEIDYNG